MRGIAIAVSVCLLALLADLALARAYPRWFDDDGVAHHTGIMVAMLLSRYFLYAVGGYLAARSTNRSVLLVAVLIVAAVGFVRAWDGATMWFHYANLALAIPFVLLGGWLAKRRMIKSK